jgi:hypothetical protein
VVPTLKTHWSYARFLWFRLYFSELPERQAHEVQQGSEAGGQAGPASSVRQHSQADLHQGGETGKTSISDQSSLFILKYVFKRRNLSGVRSLYPAVNSN